MITRRFRYVVLWQPGSASEPTTAFHQDAEGQWCKAEHVAILEARLEHFVTPGALRRAWYWLFGRRMPAMGRIA